MTSTRCAGAILISEDQTLDWLPAEDLEGQLKISWDKTKNSSKFNSAGIIRPHLVLVVNPELVCMI